MVRNSVCAGMIERGSGQIVNNSSMAGKAGYPCRGYYSASKHALIGMMDSLRFEVRLDTANGVFALQPPLKYATIIQEIFVLKIICAPNFCVKIFFCSL